MSVLTKYFLIFLSFLFSLNLYAQPSKIQFRERLEDSVQVVNTAIPPPKQKNTSTLRSEISGGIRLNTDGWAVFIDYGMLYGSDRFGRGNADKFYHLRLIQLELSEKMHPKEIGSTSSIGSPNLSPNTYKLGKANNFYQAKLSYGGRYMLAGKPDSKTVSMHLVYLGGFSAGFLKPYYVNAHGKGNIKYGTGQTEDSLTFIDSRLIQGRSGVLVGLNEIKFVTGFSAKLGLHFDYATMRQHKYAIEVGISADYYSKPIFQMVEQKPRSFFTNLYIALQFGKKR